MPSEITAYLQTQTQTQTPQNVNSSSDRENSQPGLFDLFMSEYISAEENITEPDALINTNGNSSQLITFTGANSLSHSVIDILADLNDNANIPDTCTQKDAAAKVKAVISDKIGAVASELPNDDINELVSQILNDESIPEETKNEIINELDELVNTLKDSDYADGNVKTFALKLSDIIHEHVNTHKFIASVYEADDPNASNDSDDDSINSEVNIASVNTAGAAMIQNADTKPSESVNENESETQSDIPQANQLSHQNVQTRNVTHESKPSITKANAETQNEPEAGNVNHEPDFDEHIEASDSKNRTSDGNMNQNNSNNPSGHEENSEPQDNASGTQSISRPRNDNRRTSSSSAAASSSRSENERTESRSTFQSFFEGVLSTRRNASRTSPAPLNISQNLQTASYTLSQSQTLRDGMINVVRFIRADGMQKANVIVDPPALGRISVELSSTSSGVEASIKVASEQIRQLVQDQLSELRMNLSQQGVQVAEFTVDVQQDNSNGSHQNHSNEENRYRAFAVSESDDDTEEFRIDLEEGLLYWVA